MMEEGTDVLMFGYNENNNQTPFELDASNVINRESLAGSKKNRPNIMQAMPAN